MSNSDLPDEVAKIISNILVEQQKSLHTNSSEFQALLGEQKIDEIILLSILPIYKVLKVLHNDNKINTEVYMCRINSLMNILQLLEDITKNGE